VRHLLASLLFLILLISPSAWAVSNSCSLLQSATPPELKLSAEEESLYRKKLRTECWIIQTNNILKTQLQSRFQLSLEQITEYQAMRFIRRVDFENSKASETPVELTYQIHESQYELPNSQKSSIIWDNWVKGISQLSSLREGILKGEAFTYEKLKQAHINFFLLSDEVGDNANPPDVGVIKPPSTNDNYWWVLETPQDIEQAKAAVNTINEQYRSLGLLPHFADETLNRVLDVRMTVRRQPPEKQNVIEYVTAIFSGQTRANLTHLQNILNFVRTMLNLAIQNRPLVWNGHLMTPGEVAYLAQKFYVGVHPFSEGNGRTSRLLQELILTTMDMPHGSSGDLMDDDVLTTFPDYYSKAMQSNVALMQKMKNCLEVYIANPPAQWMNGDQSAIDYSCRILKNKN
jgi:hypothetical protein